MLRYPCLVLDHDDTVVRSEETLNYPSFLVALEQLRPGQTLTRDEYTRGCFSPGFSAFCEERYHFSDEELKIEYEIWQNYIGEKIPPIYDGIAELIMHYREAGGIVTVVSHSSANTITRDYMHHFGYVPDHIYGWDYPPEQRKPSPWPLLDIMKRYHLSPDEILVVDDLKPGCDMARAAGVDFAFSGWDRKNVPEIFAYMKSNSDYSFESPAELERFLLGS